jgi:DMSO/TMAO reductase YedYZ molybdopterin-dependent catalytic subunit
LFILSAGPSIQIAGGAPLQLSDLEALGPQTAEWTSHGEKHQVLGVPLDKVLTRIGFSPGEKKRPGYRKILIATGADGYTAVFSTAELMESMGATRALLVWKLDGKPLPKDQGDFRLVVLTDKEGARCVYQLTKLELVEPSGMGTPANAR